MSLALELMLHLATHRGNIGATYRAMPCRG